MLLGIVGWVVVGMIVGLVVSRVLDLHGDDPRLGIAVAAVGGVAGGLAHRWFGGGPVVAFDAWALVWAAVGGVVAVGVWHVVRSRSVNRGPQTVRRSY